MSNANKAIQMMLSKRSKEGRKDEIKVKYTDVHNLIPNEHNTYPMTDIEKLACFIKLSGDITPLTLKPREDGKFIILSGHRRTQAVLYLIEQDSSFSPMIPYVEAKSNEFLDFLDENDRETLAICLPNEGQRRELTAAERAEVLKRLRPVVKKIYDQGDVGTHFRKFFAEFLDMSESQIQRAEAYSKLSESLKNDVDSGIIAPSVAALLVGMEPEEQDILVQKIRDSGQRITKQTITDFLHKSRAGNDVPEPPVYDDKGESNESLAASEDEDVGEIDSIQTSSDEYAPESVNEKNIDDEELKPVNSIEEKNSSYSENISSSEDNTKTELSSEAKTGSEEDESCYSELDDAEPSPETSHETLADAEGSEYDNMKPSGEPSSPELPEDDTSLRLNSSSDTQKVKEYKKYIANYFDILTTVHSESEFIDFIDMLRDELVVVKNDLIEK